MDKQYCLDVIGKAYEILNNSDQFNENVVTRELEILGCRLTQEQEGFCLFNKIRLLREGEEVYRIERKDGTRFEYFFEILRRQYEGDRFSFCEYLDLAEHLGSLPEREDILRWYLTLADIADMYSAYAGRIFGNNKGPPLVSSKEQAYAWIADRFDKKIIIR